MTKLEEFTAKPWHKDSNHHAYADSFLHMRPAPEYASGEVVLASVYRNLGLQNVTEGNVPSLGRKFNNLLNSGKRPPKNEGSTGIDPDSWRSIISGNLKSPKQPNQTAKRFLQIMPLVPDAAAYSLSARLSKNSWNPGELVNKIIEYGYPSHKDSCSLRHNLFDALSVDETDDIWARFLQQEFQSWRLPAHEIKWGHIKHDRSDTVSQWHKSPCPCPAQQFVRDLQQILQLKTCLTRRQWISMLESLLRLGTATHILWICGENKRTYDLIRAAMDGDDDLIQSLKSNLSDRIRLRFGQQAIRAIEELAIEFIRARAGINLLLWLLEEQNIKPPNIDCCLSNKDEIDTFIAFIYSNREQIDRSRYNLLMRNAMSSNPRESAGKKGVASNIKEFLRHVLGQRQTAEKGLDSYDQGYFLKKNGAYRSAPWIVSLGPVAVLSIVHSLAGDSSTPQTVDNLCGHLAKYGIEIDAQDIPTSALGKILRDLGLVLDSPDAEGGMVVISPFAGNQGN